MSREKIQKSFPFNYVHIQPIFFTDYPNLIEIMTNIDREYLHIVAIYKEKTFVIPFRSNITHKYSYRFKPNDPNNKKGIDYSKALIIEDLSKYTYKSQKNIPQYQHDLIKRDSEIIVRRFMKYVDDYCKNAGKTESSYFRRVGKYSSLQNYHEELKIYIEK